MNSSINDPVGTACFLSLDYTALHYTEGGEEKERDKELRWQEMLEQAKQEN